MAKCCLETKNGKGGTGVYLSGQTIVEIVKWLGAAGTVIGAFFAVFRFLERDKRQQTEIAAIKREQTVMCYGILACLKGL